MIGSLAIVIGLLNPVESHDLPNADFQRRVSDRKPNRNGKVLVLMYHRIEEKEANMVRSVENFKKDLNRLYKMGFRPVTLNEYATNTMQLPRGASPVVITWDDSWTSQFKLNPDGSLNSLSGMGIMKKFSEKYEDFSPKATFFILPNGPFGQKKQASKKLAMLKSWGCEIASHTITHRDLAKLNDSEVMKELSESYTYIEQLGFKARSFAMPYGSLPKNRQLLESFELAGKKFGYDTICLAGAAPAHSPLSPKFDPRRIQRIKAYDGPYGVTYWLNKVSAGKTEVYVQP